ncbi:pre-toxin TG domain-containing protein [Enterococcus sp. AZ101]|uniref:pre-toxin TG domain-containing protein n=1 Tax=Enterococcus sp. AZ101 TaxID=2774742 RepID=UPI003D28511A
MKVYLNGKYSEQASANLMYAQSKEGMKKLGIALTNMAGEMTGMYSLYRLFTGTDPVTGSKVSRLEAGLWVALLLLPQAKMVEAVKTLRAGDRALAGAALTEADLMILNKAGYFDDVAKINKIEKVSGANQKVVEEITNPVLEAPRSGSGLKVDDIKPVKGKGSVYDIDPLTGKPPTKQTQIIIDEFPNVPKAHGFSDIIDNYAGLAEVTDLGNAKLYQIQGSQNGVMGRFEWIIQDGKVTHRMFVRNPELNGVPIK